MHDRPEPEYNPNFETRSDSVAATGRPSFRRTFNPDDLNLGDLAEVIRSLLTSDGPTGADLLSSPSRGSHVVEAYKAD